MELFEEYYTDNFETFEEWLELIKLDENIYPRFRIPYEEWLEEYILNIKNKSVDDVKELLRYLLSPFTRSMDQADYDNLNVYSKNLDSLSDNARRYYKESMNIEKYKRIESGQEAWEGLTWALQLLPFRPYKAIKALKVYLEAEVGYMPDDRIIGIEQCVAIIEAKFIHKYNGLENFILELKPREFEWLIEILYKDIGYKTTLTPATRDGGKDIIARITREDGKEAVYVECKLYKTTELRIETVRAFAYSVINDRINRGVLFCTGYASEKLKELDPRIQIWTLEEIITLLNAHIGGDWHTRLHLLIENQRRKYNK